MRFLVGLLLAAVVSTASISARQVLPPMSLTEIRKDIKELESPEEKLRTYIELSNRFLRNSHDSLMAVAREIRELDGISQDQKDAFASFFNANAYRLKNVDSTLYYADIASNKLKALREHESYLMMENLRATQYSRTERYLEAESLFLEAISYRQEFDEHIQYPIQYFYGNLGNLYVRVGAHDLAIKMFEKFLEYEDNPASRCNILSKLASSFMSLESYDKAIEILSPCLEFTNLPPPIRSMVPSNLSSMYQQKGELETATQFLEQAVEISQKYRIPNISNSQVVRLGNLYIDQNQLDKADEIVAKLNQPATTFSRPNEDIHKLRFLAKWSLEKGKYDDAISYSDEGISMAKKFNLSQMIIDEYAIKAQAYEELGDIDEALVHERLQRQHDEDLSRKRKEWGENMMSVRYQLQNKEAQLADANLQLENIRTRNLLIIIGLILISGYIFYRYRVFYLLKEEKTRNQIARDLHDDLSGTLSSISFFSEAAKRVQKDPGESRRFLDIIDESASEAKEKINDIIWAIDPSKDDWKMFTKKCKRFASDLLDSNNIEYVLHISEDLEFPLTLEVRQNIWLIFKECVTNLSKHSQANFAEITLKGTKNEFFLEVRDNGVGFDPEKIGRGNGVKNIRYRAQNIGGTVNLKTSPGKGTVWTFEIK